MVKTSLRIRPKSRLSDDVAKRIEFAIKGGQFLPGVKLPAERNLSRELGVSRPILRQALQILETRGLVDIQHGRGTFVATLKNEFMQPTEWLHRNREKVVAFYEARMVIEPECAALAARRAAVEQLNELHNNVKNSARATNEGDIFSFIGLDIEFHSVIARLSGNPHLYHALDQIINPETDARQVIHRLPGHLLIAQARHEKVYEAIAARDEQAAREAMYAAFKGVISELEELGI